MFFLFGKRNRVLNSARVVLPVFLGILLGLTQIPDFSFAQSADQPGYRPGSEAQNTSKKPKKPPPSMDIPEASGQFIPEELEDIEIHITGIEIVGGTEVLSDERQEQIDDFLAREEKSLADFYRLANSITQVYRRAGFILTRALIPAQNLGVGDGKIEIIEGWVSEINVEAEDGAAERHVRRTEELLDPIIGIKPVNLTELERQLLILSEQAGFTARTIIRPAKELGSAQLIVKLTIKSYDITLNYDNAGTEFIGFSQYSGTFTANTILGMGESFTFNWKQGRDSTELSQAAFVASVPIGVDGLLASTSVSLTQSEPVHTLSVAEVESKTKEYEASLSYPFLLSRQGTFRATAGIRHRAINVDILENDDTKDRLTEAFIGFDYDEANRVGDAVAISFRAIRNNAWFSRFDDRDPLLSRDEANDKYHIFRLDMSRSQTFSFLPGFAIEASLSGQYAHQPLHSSNEFQVGGADFGRGYDSGEISGDYGAKGKLELRYTPDFSWFTEFPKLGEYADVTFHAFYDLGYVRNHDIEDQGELAGDKRSRISLASIGLGATFVIDEMMTLSFEYARPQTKHVARTDSNTDFDTTTTRPSRIYSALELKF